MGAPIFEWKDFVKKHGIAIHSSNYPLYGDMSNRVIEVLHRFTPDLEVYSIDEAFLGLAHLNSAELETRAGEMRETVYQWTGIPVSVGIAPTKTLAKLASKRAKKLGGVCVLRDTDELEDVLADFPVTDLWGIGGQYKKLLHRHGIRTALQYRDARAEWIQKQLTICGLRTQMELKGTACIKLEDHPPDKKGIGCSRSFGKMITDLPDLKEALATYVARSAEKLRRQQSAAGIVHVFLLTNRFREDLDQYMNAMTMRLPVASSYTPELIEVALNLLERIYRPGYRYKKVGVLLMDIVGQNNIQQDLFHQDYPHEKRTKTMAVMDTLNTRYGSNTMAYGAMGFQKPWRMNQQQLSPRFTTAWQDLLVVSGG